MQVEVLVMVVSCFLGTVLSIPVMLKTLYQIVRSYFCSGGFELPHHFM